MSDRDRTLVRDLALAHGVLERAAHLRADDAWLIAARARSDARAMWVVDGRLAVRADADTLAFTPPSSAGDRDVAFLGLDADSVPYFAVHGREADIKAMTDVRWLGLRDVGMGLAPRDAGLAVTAIALDNWRRTHARCPRCGTPTEPASAGWSRRCPTDGSEHFPRTDPAVIMLVRDREDRALLGRQARWGPGWFSTLAGFVESGESAEAAVRREVKEECGLVLGDGPDDVVYLGSQPWPFPCSLMLGFHAWTDATEVVVDGDEIAEARWFSRDELAGACAEGEVRLPPTLSISRRLIEHWYGAALPGSWSR